MITNDPGKLESVKSEEYLDVDNMYSLIPIEVRLHMQRVCGYSCIISKLLKESGLFEQEEIDVIEQNSGDIFRYHDIGYSFLPVKTLCKSKRTGLLDIRKFLELDFDGDSVCNAHVELAFDAFDIPLFNRFSKLVFKNATQVAVHHHERWDGKGFPKGLKDGDIPLVARICAVADMYDMLVEFNPYKEDEDNNRIIEGLEQVSGDFLDPEIVDIVRKNADVFRKYDHECGNISLF